MTRDEVLGQAVDQCLKEIYSKVQPSVEWDDFIKQNEEFLKKEEEYYKIPDKKRPSYHDYMGPKPYEFYYLPKEIMKEICDSYIYAYRIDSQQELLNTIEILKNYCKEPIVDKYIEGELREDGTRWPGHRGYDHPDNLIQELIKLLTLNNLNLGGNTGQDIVDIATNCQDKFFEFLDMAGNFYNWNRDLNSFNMTVYLGSSPNSNKQAVIDNWKKYRNQDIEIDEDQIKKEYYGEELD